MQQTISEPVRQQAMGTTGRIRKQVVAEFVVFKTCVVEPGANIVEQTFDENGEVLTEGTVLAEV